jgi:hypothetical protein
LRHEEERRGSPALRLEHAAQIRISLGLAARRNRRARAPALPHDGRRLEQIWRPLEEERRRGSFFDRTAQPPDVLVFRRRPQRREPSASERLEHPEPHVVREPHLRERELLRQEVEREEIDERQVAQDVENRPARVGRAHLLRPRLVDLDVLEEALVRPGERGARLIRPQLHGAISSGALPLRFASLPRCRS